MRAAMIAALLAMAGPAAAGELNLTKDEARQIWHCGSLSRLDRIAKKVGLDFGPTDPEAQKICDALGAEIGEIFE